MEITERSMVKKLLCEDGCLMLFLTHNLAFHIVQLRLLVMQLYFPVLLFAQCYCSTSHSHIYFSI